tara:strand:- start:3515 stop:3889 length:375 start_codon:yes stop_codon:yes gene_type:complete
MPPNELLRPAKALLAVMGPQARWMFEQEVERLEDAIAVVEEHTAPLPAKPSLRDYVRAIPITECPGCLNPLPPAITYYSHPDGWPVAEFDSLQWLYITCAHCEIDWALWKLGVPRPGQEVTGNG